MNLNLKASIEDNMGIFSGRVSKVNIDASLVRVKVDFSNLKYLNKRDKIEFWDERGSAVKCKGYIVGKSNEYLLMKVPEYGFCTRYVLISPGGYLRFFSQDLVNNLKMGRELISILLKKRLALSGKLQREQRELDAHIEKINAVNDRYRVLRDKLEAEWRDEIAAIEEDKIIGLRNFKDAETRLLDIDNKLEKYRIEDNNLRKDRWALDPRLYYNK